MSKPTIDINAVLLDLYHKGSLAPRSETVSTLANEIVEAKSQIEAMVKEIIGQDSWDEAVEHEPTWLANRNQLRNEQDAKAREMGLEI